MKKIAATILGFILIISLAACGNKSSTAFTPNESERKQEETTVATNQADDGIHTQITLTAGDIVLEGYLNDSNPAKSLIEQLPLTVTLNDSDNDFCGGNINITYSEADIQMGYQNRDLAFWTPANNFVIFVSGEESSATTGDIVNLGKLTSSEDEIARLSGTIEVMIALKDDTSENQESNEVSDKTVEDISQNSEQQEIQQSSTKSDTTEGEIDVNAEQFQVKITVGDTELVATLENNATTQYLVSQMPMTLPMMDLYGREMCYRYGANALPTDHLQSDGYEVGDLAYWAPGGSVVILYKQNGEKFERQHLGHIDSGVDVFETMGDTDVTFELIQ